MLDVTCAFVTLTAIALSFYALLDVDSCQKLTNHVGTPVRIHVNKCMKIMEDDYYDNQQ